MKFSMVSAIHVMAEYSLLDLQRMQKLSAELIRWEANDGGSSPS